ncbi:MAG TPA: hypothetical protein VFI03_01840 [Solirubrobacterales bacterium]|nr:hypothetical protein [Solirubrobacterales bacterium]
MKQIRKRLTYANVMSSIAVFLVLGGAMAVAASTKIGSKQLKANAVTTGKIKKSAVTTAKIKDNAVNGTKVDEATLGTVPSATNAAFASSIPPAEPTHLVGTPGQPPFEAGSKNVGSSGPFQLTSVGFYKDHEGIVHLEGVALIGNGGGGVSSVFTLPPGYRPAPGTILLFEGYQDRTMIIAGSNTATEGIDLSGKIISDPEKPIILDGITFRAAS